MLLPPIILHQSFSINTEHFFSMLSPILLFAFVGTFISALMIGCVIYVGLLFVMVGMGLKLRFIHTLIVPCFNIKWLIIVDGFYFIFN